MIPEKPFYTPDELAQVLEVNKRVIYHLCKTGKLPYYKVGRFIRVKYEDFHRYLLQAKQQETQPA